MSLKRSVDICVITLFAVVLFGCAGGGKLLIDETYSELKPVKPLELPEQIEYNLSVSIFNVADQTSSYKNHVDLFVNDRRIEPNWLVSNVEDTYTYNLKLKPGYYEVKARYYAFVGWGDEKFDIESQELVRVTPTTRTILECNIEKMPNGVPVNNKMYFKIKSEPLSNNKAEKDITTESAIPKPAKVIKPSSKKMIKKIYRRRK